MSRRVACKGHDRGVRNAFDTAHEIVNLVKKSTRREALLV